MEPLLQKASRLFSVPVPSAWKPEKRNGGLNHDELCKAAEKEGFIAAYDGMEIEAP